MTANAKIMMAFHDQPIIASSSGGSQLVVQPCPIVSMPSSPKEVAPRAVCYACFRPQGLCYCAEVVPIQNKTRVLILQHPRERFHPLGTARIVDRCLKNSEVVVTHRGHLDSVNQADRFPPGSALLYPGKSARDLRDLAPEQLETLIVLDGTWHHARTLYRDVSQLHRLPCFSFLPERPTEYRVRREPKAEYVSTVEAVTHVLRTVEPETRGLEAMMSCFRKLVDLHIDATTNAGRSPRHRQRPKSPAQSEPAALR